MDFAEEFARIDGGPSCMVMITVLIIMVIIMVTVSIIMIIMVTVLIIITTIMVQYDIAWGIPSGRR